MSFHSFGATNEPDTCLWCGRKLRRSSYTEWITTDKTPKRCTFRMGMYRDLETCGDTEFRRDGIGWRCKAHDHYVPPVKTLKTRTPNHDKPGDYGDGFFCGLRCGYMFGRALANGGDRLKPKGEKDR